MYKFQNISTSRDFLSPKEIAAYCLLIIYLLAAYKPLLPVITDLLAHTFYEANHVESVHHKHGSNHLQSEIIRAERQDDKNNILLKFSEPVGLHLAAHISYTFPQSVSKPQYLPSITYNLYTTSLDRNYPPPKFA
ncbi:MAG: hypothetical protein ABIR81_08325 [Ginsengibacter sp.]